MAGQWVPDASQPSGYRWQRDDIPPDPSPTSMLPVYAGPVTNDPHAETAGEQDHTNAWFYAGEDADPPVDPR